MGSDIGAIEAVGSVVTMTHKYDRALRVLASEHRLGLHACHAFKGEIAAALGALDRSRSTKFDVHEARKQIKRARATLRLLRAAIGDISYCREDEALRSAARELNEHRDSEVLLRTYDRISRKIEGSRRKAGIAPLRAFLLRARKSAARTLQSNTLPRAASVLKDAQSRIRHARAADDWNVLSNGLTRTYRKGRRALHKVQRSSTDRRLHAWRKQAKYTWHHLETLRVLAPEYLDGIARRFSRLSDHIGDDHDLAILSARARECTPTLDKSSLRTLSKMIKHRRQELQTKAVELGDRLYRHPPGKFLTRLSEAAQKNTV
jgi:CHAD domain-containing protein